jgi:hypothetical protein
MLCTLAVPTWGGFGSSPALTVPADAPAIPNMVAESLHRPLSRRPGIVSQKPE